MLIFKGITLNPNELKGDISAAKEYLWSSNEIWRWHILKKKLTRKLKGYPLNAFYSMKSAYGSQVNT